MTISEYTNRMEERWQKILKKKTYDLQDVDVQEMFSFQREYLTNIIDTYQEQCIANPIVVEMLEYIRDDSESGSCCRGKLTNTKADEVAEILSEEFGDYLLDSPAVYEKDDGWCVDIVFGGFFVPEWNGFEEEWEAQNEMC